MGGATSVATAPRHRGHAAEQKHGPTPPSWGGAGKKYKKCHGQ